MKIDYKLAALYALNGQKEREATQNYDELLAAIDASGLSPADKTMLRDEVLDIMSDEEEHALRLTHRHLQLSGCKVASDAADAVMEIAKKVPDEDADGDAD